MKYKKSNKIFPADKSDKAEYAMPNMFIKYAVSLAIIDKYCWRCKSNAPKHNNKINIRTESLFEGMRIPLNGLYFLIRHGFLNQYSKKVSYKEMLKFWECIKINSISQYLIIKIFRKIRQK